LSKSRSPAVAVVIRCHNEGRHIGRLLRGIGEQTVVPAEVVAVDSGSTDDTVSILNREGVRVIHLRPAAFSFGRSLNMGIAATSTDVVVIASAHVYPLYDSWLELLTAPFERDMVALSYGRQIGADASKFSERRVFARWYPRRSVESQTDPFCNNANAAVRRSVWRDLQYDEELTGLEDLDWAKRALARGYEIAYCADAIVAHVHEESWMQIANRYRREAIAHKLIYGDQRMHLLRALTLAATNIGSDYLHAVRERELLRHLTEIPAFRIAQFWGTYRGFAQHGPVARSLRERFYYPSETHPELVKDPPSADHGSLIDYGDVGEKMRASPR
jgi:rhamnosyltransferase